MGVKKLAEAIILQSMEDLWDAGHRAESMKFFFGEEFHMCAHMAGLSSGDKLKVLNLVRGILKVSGTPRPVDVRHAPAPAMAEDTSYTPPFALRH